jgi:hypothetical protein
MEGSRLAHEALPDPRGMRLRHHDEATELDPAIKHYG